MSVKAGADRQGFTIIELLVATAVFSLVLMAAVSGFLQIGRLFYKGVVTNRTQVVANQLLASIVADIQDSPASGTIAIVNDPPDPSVGYTYFCAGGARYTLNFDKPLDIANINFTDGFGVLRDELPGNNACAPPCVTGAPSPYDCSAAKYEFNNPEELLANNIRLDSLSLGSPVSNPTQLYNVKVRVVSGDDETVQIDTAQPLSASNVVCNSNLQTSQYCSAASVSNVVFAGDYGP